MVSSIYTAQNNGFMGDIWKFTSNFYVAIAATCNLLVIYLLLNHFFFHGDLSFFIIRYLNFGGINFILNLLTYFIFPIMIINHFLIYKEDKYKALIKEYKKSYSKSFFAIYFSVSFFGTILGIFTLAVIAKSTHTHIEF